MSILLRSFLVVVLVVLLVAESVAHVGSPNVFYDGSAGPFQIRVVIRPPIAIPGDAQFDVRVENATSILIQPAYAGATIDQAEPPVPEEFKNEKFARFRCRSLPSRRNGPGPM